MDNHKQVMDNHKQRMDNRKQLVDKHKQVGISVLPELLNKIDKTAQKMGVSRSRFIVECVDNKLSSVDNYEQPQTTVNDGWIMNCP